MAGRKLPILPNLATFPESGDKMYVVDVSDTSESPQGTSKQINFGVIAQIDKTFAPTVSALENGTFSVTNFLITEVGGVVEFSFGGRFDLDGGEVGGTCKIDLPSAFQPAANWASETDVNTVLHRTNSIFTGECKIAADDSGTKLLVVNVADTTAAASIRFSAIGRYKRS